MAAAFSIQPVSIRNNQKLSTDLEHVAAMKLYHSEHEKAHIPDLDLLTALFDSDYTKAEEDTEIHVEAANPANSITKSEARDLVRRVGYVLRYDFGIGVSGPGKDVVLSTTSGSPFLPIMFYSVLAAGGVASGASTAFTVNELIRQAKDCNAKVLLCTKEYEARTVEAAKELGISIDNILVLDSSTPRDWKLISSADRSNVLERGKGQMLDWTRITDRKQLENTLACLVYSSGTTGLPKGVLLSHRNLVANSPVTMACSNNYCRRRAREGKPFFFRTVAHLPMAHIAGVTLFSINPFYMGGTTYWMEKFDFDKFIHYVRKYKITYQFTVPPIWLQIAKSSKVTDHFDTMEIGFTGAAPMGAELVREVSTKIGNRLYQMSGMTEATGTITALDWERSDESGSVGNICANLTVRFIDDEENDVEEGQRGELCVAGPVVSPGYHNRPEANAGTFVDRFYRTGDIGYFKDGLVYLVDRKKELIKYKGLQVAPAELEDLLASHPKIIDAAVIGVVDKSQATEVPRAYVVVRGATPSSASSVLSEQEIKDYVKQRLAGHKQLRGGVVFVDAIPKSPSGKILRKLLRERVAKEQRARL